MEKKIDPALIRAYMMGGVAQKDRKPTKKMGASVVDLHIRHHNARTADPAFAIQIARFEKEIDDALCAGLSDIRLIHGNGKGKLKQALHHFLLQHPHIRSFENNYHPSYGWGSTLVIFK